MFVYNFDVANLRAGDDTSLISMLFRWKHTPRHTTVEKKQMKIAIQAERS